MIGIGHAIKTIIDNIGVNIIPPKFIQKLSNQRLILPFYHIISDEECPHIRHLYSVKGVQAFINDLDFLLKYYKPIHYNEFKELIYLKKQPEKPSFLLSFDDGLKEFHDIIAPILIKKGIPAICFLNSGFIDNKDLFYRYKASLLIDKITKNPKLNKCVSEQFKNSQNVIRSILSVKYQNKEILDEIAKLVEFDFKYFLSEHSPYLSRDQIQSLINQGFYFGTHSIDHPEYQYLDIKEQIRQTKESMQFIEEMFSLDYKIFSFPFTDYNVSRDFFTQIQRDEIADNTFGCAGQKKDSIANNFQRIPFEVSNHSAKKIHNAQLFYYLLKMPFGKNIIRRK